MLELSSRPKNPPHAAEAARVGNLHILLAAPRGFCAGVRRAIDAVRHALAVHGAPVYVRRAIVHNLEVVRGLEAEGAIFVEDLDEVPDGAVVMFSAHGVTPAINQQARSRGLRTYDAVCPLVAKVHREVERHQRGGRAVVLIGHEGHPEIEGTLGHVGAGPAFVVRTRSQVSALPLSPDTPVAYAIQTTYSVEEAQQIVEALRERFLDLAEPPSSDICYATTNRQGAIRAVAERSNAVIVVGERFSSNACRLAEVAGAHCGKVQLAAGPHEIDWNLIPAAGVVGIGAAASTPENSVQAIIAALSDRHSLSFDDLELSQETAIFKPLEIA